MSTSYKNIRSEKTGFCCDGEYFYTFLPYGDSAGNMLIQKTSNGDPVMTYPFSHEIKVYNPGGDDDEWLSIQFDGINFWTLERGSGSQGGDTRYNLEPTSYRVLRRWRIENYVCTLKDTWRLRPQGNETAMDGQAFAIETYYNSITHSCGYGVGAPHTDMITLKYPHAAFFHVTDNFLIKSASGNYSEDMPVYTTPSNYTVKTAAGFQNTYYPGDEVILTRDLYFFNNQSPDQGASSAAVYRFKVPKVTAADPKEVREPTYKGCHDSGIYEGTRAATFVTASGLAGINEGYYTGLVVYVRGAQLLMKKPGMPSGGIAYPGQAEIPFTPSDQEYKENVASMLMDNAIKNDRVSMWYIYDLGYSMDPSEHITTNIYRLQAGYTYGADEGTWSAPGEYNYVVSVMQPMVTSIALTAEPALVVANGVDRAIITATVRDQYGAALNYKRVVFGIQNHEGSYFICPENISECTEGSFTWLDGTPHRSVEILTGSQSSYPGGPPAMQGQAIVEWRSGTTAGIVTITATVQP